MIDAAEFFGYDAIAIYHGSPRMVKHPKFGEGSSHNDFGLAFYMTEVEELAFEWACPTLESGWANEYALDARGLSVLDLNGDEFTVLNWMATLLAHRRISMEPGIAAEARTFIIENYSVDLSDADIVYGYRADDSNFHIARSFLNNRIPVEVLEQSLFLGGLGYQAALKSQTCFEHLTWVSAQSAAGNVWHPRRIRRDSEARRIAGELERMAASSSEGTFIIDIMRGSNPWPR